MTIGGAVDAIAADQLLFKSFIDDDIGAGSGVAINVAVFIVSLRFVVVNCLTTVTIAIYTIAEA